MRTVDPLTPVFVKRTFDEHNQGHPAEQGSLSIPVVLCTDDLVFRC